MVTLKNIFQITLLITYLFRIIDSVLHDEHNKLPNLNEPSMEVLQDEEQCINNIYSEFQCSRPVKSRSDIPKNIKFDDLKTNDAKAFFMYLHNNDTISSKFDLILTPEEFCSGLTEPRRAVNWKRELDSGTSLPKSTKSTSDTGETSSTENIYNFNIL